MTRQPRLLVFSNHVLLRIVAASPALGRIDVDVFRSAEAVHRIVHLNSFPTMIVVIFIKNKIERLPPGSKKRVVTLLMRHVLEFVNLSPVVPLETIVELRIAF